MEGQQLAVGSVVVAIDQHHLITVGCDQLVKGECSKWVVERSNE